MPPSSVDEARAGAVAILPAVIAMVPFALLLGQQAAAKGLTPLEMLAMSSIVFAGSSQFLAIGLWTTPAPAVTLALAVLLINLRHVLMSASIAGKIGHFTPLQRVFGLYFLTDESWAVAERRALSQKVTLAFYLGASLTLFVCWQIGTVTGTFVGALIEDPARYGFDFAFPAIFIALALGFWRGMRTAPVIAAAAIVAVIVHRLVPGAWYVLAGAFAGMLAAVVMDRLAPEAAR